MVRPKEKNTAENIGRSKVWAFASRLVRTVVKPWLGACPLGQRHTLRAQTGEKS
jgi:hypothetical protein